MNTEHASLNAGAKALPDGANLNMKPLRMAPNIKLGWFVLELFVNKVLPHIDLAPPQPAAIPSSAL